MKQKAVNVEGYGRECDIWSAGVLLYSLVFGIMPYRGGNVREIKDKILNDRYEVIFK